MWPVGQAVKTEASHAFNIGSIPVRVIFAPLAQLVEQLTLNQWAQGSSPWRCTTTTKSELFPIGAGFGFFVFFGQQNESIASPEKWSAGVCRPDSQWWPGGILEKCNREPQARNLNECWTVPFLSWCCPAFFWRWLTNFNGIFIFLQFSLRLFYLFHANLYAHG